MPAERQTASSSSQPVPGAASAKAAASVFRSPRAIAKAAGKTSTADDEFRETLALDETLFEAFKKDIRVLIDNLLDVTKYIKDQPDEVTELKRQLEDAYPEVFESNKVDKMRSVTKYVSKRHGWLRFEARKQSSSQDTASVKTSPPPSPSLSSTSLPPAAVRSITQSIECIDLRTPSPEIEPFQLYLNPPPLPSTSLTLPARPATGPRKASTMVELFSGSSERNIEGVRFFLRTCTPPMEEFLPRFVNYGCHSLRFLQGAKRWPREEIDAFLRDLPTGGGRVMTPMEVRVLKMHLLSFNFDEKPSSGRG